MSGKRERDKKGAKADIGTNTSLKEFSSTFDDEHVGEFESLSESDSSTPEAKKGKMDLTLQQLQENLMQAINQNTEKIMIQINRNADSIDQIKLQMASLVNDLGETKDNEEEMRGKLCAYEKRMKELEERVDDQERYHRQWNLRLFGLPEREGENIMKIVADICYEVVPECRDSDPLLIDICHRL